MYSYNIGLDFGTTNSIISYLNEEKLEIFQYGGPDGQKYIPSFITYENDYVEIGRGARTTASQTPDVESYSNFKMDLPLPESQFTSRFKNARTPMSITADYLRELFLSSSSFSREEGQINSVVVSVPEIWQRDVSNLGRERLQKLIQELGLPLKQLISEPVAAAAFYAWETQKRAKQDHSEPFRGNLLVCDMGGGTFDVSLCHVYGDNKVEVLYFDGQGDKGLDSAGVAFDRRCVQIAYAKKHGHPPDETSSEFLRLLRDFETVKIYSHDKSRKKLTNCLKEPEAFIDKEIYKFAGQYDVTFGEITEAFTPIARGIKAVMQGVKDWLQCHDQTVERLFFVGGFSQFLLVQKAIFDVLRTDDNDPRFERSFNITSSAYAIAYGACLIANGLVDPTEKYIHTMGIVINKEIHFEIKEEEITLIKGGISLGELNQPQFYDQPLVAWQESFRLVLWIEPQSKGKRYRKQLQEPIKLPNYSSSAEYKVGMWVNPSQVAYLLIEEIHTNECVEYELGNIISKLFSGFVLPEEANSDSVSNFEV